MSNPVNSLARYGLDHLVVHLVEAGRDQDVHYYDMLHLWRRSTAWRWKSVAMTLTLLRALDTGIRRGVRLSLDEVT